MPDIAKYCNESCPSKDSCYRYTVEPSPLWQSYSDFEYNKETGKCNFYWENEDKGKTNTGADVSEEEKRRRVKNNYR
jgi:hypothetical protein